MSHDAASWLRTYLLPGFVFQSVVIAGGYGTGRELVEFFLTLGPAPGLAAMAVAALTWSAVCMASFEFARRFRAFDYRTFFRALLGPGWVLFELAYVAAVVIVLAVVAAASGAIARDAFGIPYPAGVALVVGAVAWLVFGGNRLVERFLAGWSVLLYAAYVVFFAWSFARFGGEIVASFGAPGRGGSWALAGVRYASYNLVVIPAVLFTLRHHSTRKASLTAGALAGPVAIVPAVLFYVAVLARYPAVLDHPVPANTLLEALGSRPFQIAFQVVLFGTLVETGAGLIHAVNERVAALREERGRAMPARLRSGLALTLLATGAALSSVGLVDLIARGYGALTWVVLAVFVIPVLTLGVWKLRALPPEPGPPG